MYNQQLELAEATEQFEQTVISNLAYAERLAQKYYSRRSTFGMGKEDFVSAAYYGLCDAATRYSKKEGRNFQTYSYLRIRGAMCDLLRKEGIVPRGYLQRKALKEQSILNSKADPANENTSSVSFSKQAKYPYQVANTGAQLASYNEVFDELGYEFYYEKSNETCDIGYANNANPEEIYSKRCLREFLKTIVDDLPSPYREVLQEHYFEDLTFKEVCEKVNVVSRGSICRTHQRALEILKERILEKNQQSLVRCHVYVGNAGK